MDPQLIHFVLNAHLLTPQRLVDIMHHRRKSRPISDSSFRPFPNSFAISDWTDKKNEPTLHLSQSFNRFLKWQWNLAITYPDSNRYTDDDNVQCAFPRISKYNPNLVAMYSAVSNNAAVTNILELSSFCPCTRIMCFVLPEQKSSDFERNQHVLRN